MVRNATPATGSHAECFCEGCRAGELYTGAPDPAPAPVGIFQTSPHQLDIIKGHEHLAVFSFGPKNLLRWHASCCGSPLFNSMRNPKVSFVGMRTNLFADTTALGPVITQSYIPAPNGKTRHEGIYGLIWQAVLRIAKNRITGRWKQTPLFDVVSDSPVAPVTLVSKADRRALLATA